jgi:purine-binding chemotaxis protein CheW
VRHVVFRLERDRYALPLSAIREVVAAPSHYTRVPRAPPVLRGVVNLRGRVVPVVDLRALLEPSLGATSPQSPSLRIVLLEMGRRDLGLLVTEVDGIESIDKVAAAPPRTGPSTVKGLARLGALAITVLDAEGLDAAVARFFKP